MPEALRVSIPARLSEVRELSSLVEGFGDANRLPDPKVFVINLALDELITNTVMHGPDAGAVQIDISLWVDAGTLFLVMEDNGHPFDPTADSSADLSSSLQDRPVGGLGLHLVKSFADRIAYEFVDGRNRLTVEHNLAKSSA
jgi:anti-sigma regulatory factor (Ser/Thr protein kinase)